MCAGGFRMISRFLQMRGYEEFEWGSRVCRRRFSLWRPVRQQMSIQVLPHLCCLISHFAPARSKSPGSQFFTVHFLLQTLQKIAPMRSRVSGPITGSTSVAIGAFADYLELPRRGHHFLDHQMHPRPRRSRELT